MKQRCKRCKHTWDYTGKKLTNKSKYKGMQWASCPKCKTSVKLKDDSQETKSDGRDLKSMNSSDSSPDTNIKIEEVKEGNDGNMEQDKE